MNLEELKQLIEKEVEAIMKNPLQEPEVQKVSKPVITQPEITEEELENFMFYGQSKKREDNNEKPKQKNSL